MALNSRVGPRLINQRYSQRYPEVSVEAPEILLCHTLSCSQLSSVQIELSYLYKFHKGVLKEVKINTVAEVPPPCLKTVFLLRCPVVSLRVCSKFGAFLSAQECFGVYNLRVSDLQGSLPSSCQILHPEVHGLISLLLKSWSCIILLYHAVSKFKVESQRMIRMQFLQFLQFLLFIFCSVQRRVPPRLSPPKLYTMLHYVATTLAKQGSKFAGGSPTGTSDNSASLQSAVTMDVARRTNMLKQTRMVFAVCWCVREP